MRTFKHEGQRQIDNDLPLVAAHMPGTSGKNFHLFHLTKPCPEHCGICYARAKGCIDLCTYTLAFACTSANRRRASLCIWGPAAGPQVNIDLIQL